MNARRIELGWLLLALPALAAAQEPEEEPHWFEDVAPAVGLEFRHVSDARPERPWFPEIMPPGGTMCDLDGDGDLDIYVVQSGSLWEERAESARNRLFRNRGDGTFEDVTDGSGADDRSYGMGATTGDYDGDGDTDLYVTNYGPNVLLRNDGNFRFTDVTDVSGAGEPNWGVSAAFSDLDADGDLDLFVSNYVTWSKETELDCRDAAGTLGYCVPTHYNSPSRDTLYRNNGDGTFTDVSETAGMTGSYGNGLGVFCADMTGDHRPDIFVANDKMLDHLWVNDGDLRFTEDGLIRGCACDEDGYAKAGMGVAVVDWDDDGDRDFLVTNFAREGDSFFENIDGYFYDRAVAVGLGFKTRKYTRFGIGFRDFDNDGFLDLYMANGRVTLPVVSRTSRDPFGESNLLFAGTPDRKLRLVLPLGGAAPAEYSSRAAIFGDYDDDGGIDVLVMNREGPAQLLRNIAGDRGNWIGFRVRNAVGADAIGAVVFMDVGDRTIQRDVLPAQSYASASDPRVHLGLGGGTGVTNVRVRWVDGTVEAFGDRAAGAYHELSHGQGREP